MENSMSKYVRLTKGLNDKGILIKPEEVQSYLKEDRDYYTSVYYYNEEQLKKFKETGSVKGIKDVTTDKIWFDFDSKDNPEKARLDTIEVVKRLKKHGIKENGIEVYFSGNKGYNVVVSLNRNLTPGLVQSLAINKFGKGLETLDVSLYDSSQILRVPGTKHHVSGLYKIPLTVEQLNKLDTDKVKVIAKDLANLEGDFEWSTATPSDEFYNVPLEEKKKEVSISETVDFSKAPKGWKPYKYALLQGIFEPGERHHALMIIASTCRALGYDKETAYYLCKSALKKQASRTGQTEFDKTELWNNIIEESVYSEGWEGGQYSPKTDPWLKKYCERMGFSTEEKEESPIIQIGDMGSKFSSFASDFESSVVKTGIRELDDNVMLCSSTLNGLLGQPGSGKTSMSLNYLRNASMNNISSTFFSLDMGMPIVFAKLVQKQTGYDFKKVLSLFKNDPKKAQEIVEILKDEYRNVGFNYRAGMTVPDIKNTVLEQEQQTGKDVKLVIIDYLECLAGPYSDPTANGGFLANQLKDLANDLEACVLLLLQTQKHSTPEISDPLLTLKNVKGSSLIEQSCSTILTLWREGYSPKYVENDKYLSFAVVKNRFGSLWSGDFSWEGVRGEITSLSEEQREELEDFRKYKKEEKSKEKEDSGWS